MAKRKHFNKPQQSASKPKHVSKIQKAKKLMNFKVPAVKSKEEIDGLEYEKENQDLLKNYGNHVNFLSSLSEHSIAKKIRADDPRTKAQIKGAIPRTLPKWNIGEAMEGESEESESEEEESEKEYISDEEPDDNVDNLEGKYHERSLKNVQQEIKKSQRLPIRLPNGIVMEQQNRFPEEEENVQEAEEEEEEEVQEMEVDEKPKIDFDSMDFFEREAYVSKMKETLANLASKILENPEENISLMKEFPEIFKEANSTVQRLCLLTQFAVFKDILPNYRIRPLSATEKSVKLSKDVKKLRNYEETFLKYYQKFLQSLENILQGYKKFKRQGNKLTKQAQGEDPKLMKEIASSEKIAVVATRCLCGLLLQNPAFNFRNNILSSIISRMPLRSPSEISEICCETIIKLFENDNHGEPSLEAVRLMSKIVKSKGYNVPSKMLDSLLYLRLIKELEPPAQVKAREAEEKKKKKEEKKLEKKTHLSKKQKMLQKQEKEIKKDLKEAEAEYSIAEKNKLHTETLKVIFQMYFRILKIMKSTPSLTSTLKGLSKFAHLINVDFFGDLMSVLKTAIQNNLVDVPTSLQCVTTAYQIIAGQGEGLDLDMKDFAYYVYKLFYSLLENNGESVHLGIECLEHLFLKKRQISYERIAAYAKRLTTLCCHLPHNGVLASIALCNLLFQKYPRIGALLENEHSGMGAYLWEIDDPDLAHAFETNLWELHLLRNHYHPTVSKNSSSLMEKDHYVGKSPKEYYEEFDSARTGGFNPDIQVPKPHPFARDLEKNKERFIQEPEDYSTFMLNLPEDESDFEIKAKQELRNQFAVAKEYLEIGKLQKEMNKIGYILGKWKEQKSKQKQKQNEAKNKLKQKQQAQTKSKAK